MDTRPSGGGAPRPLTSSVGAGGGERGREGRRLRGLFRLQFFDGLGFRGSGGGQVVGLRSGEQVRSVLEAAETERNQTVRCWMRCLVERRGTVGTAAMRLLVTTFSKNLLCSLLLFPDCITARPP